MIKKIILALIINIFFIINLTYADDSNLVELNRSDIFKYFSENILKEIPKSYKYISLNFLDVKKDDVNYEYAQKLVYSDLMENKKLRLNLNSKFNSYVFYYLLEKKTGYDFVNDSNIIKLKSRNTTNEDLIFTTSILNSLKNAQDKALLDNQTLLKIFGDDEKIKIFEDVYNTILTEHYDSVKINKEDLIYSSIEGLAKGSKDKFTTYFPPTESKNFEESLSGEFEGIGSYVDMENPGELKIISPIAGSPSEKAGIKGGDIIQKINGIEVTKSMTLQEAVSMIKGPAGTKVILDILRGEEKIQIEVIRQKIIINDAEYKILNDKFFYIQMRMFGDKIFTQTNEAIEELKKHSEIKKIIIDLRNNPGGYLDKCVNVLSLFIDKGEPVSIVKYKDGDMFYNSYGYNTINLADYEVYILANSGTASASEIMIGTLKDYFPDIEIIGEKTYGKGSVQTIRSYNDFSSLKYTIAKWYTGKTITGIDGIGIFPDIELELDIEKFKTGVDNQLDFILNKVK